MSFNTLKMRGQIIGFWPPATQNLSRRFQTKACAFPWFCLSPAKGTLLSLFTDKTLCLNNCNVGRDGHPRTSGKQLPKKRKKHSDQFFVCTVFYSAGGTLRKKLLPGGQFQRYKEKKRSRIIFISSLPNLGHPIPSCHRAL